MGEVGSGLGLLLDRGYTGHEHLEGVELIHMNGRLYDARLHRFLAPDNYVQDPYNTQNFNRYGYVYNNPLSYSDPSGEIIHLIIGAIAGGIINWALNGAEFSAKGLLHFGVGALSGALGAGAGAGVSSILAGGTFGAGFVGSSAALTATSSFFTGAAIGASGGFAGGFTSGLGNELINGNSFGNAMLKGLLNGGYGMLSGGAIGGLYGGIDAVLDGRNFWHGGRAIEHYSIPLNPIKQNTEYDCVICTNEVYDDYFGINRPNGFYDNLRLNNPFGVELNSSYWQNNGYSSVRIGGYENLKNSLRLGNPVLLDTSTGTNEIINGVSYRFNHALTVSGFKTFNNGKTLWEIFNPAKGLIYKTYKFPSNVLAGYIINPF